MPLHIHVWGFLFLGSVVDTCIDVLGHAPNLVKLVTYKFYDVTSKSKDGTENNNYHPAIHKHVTNH